MVKNVLIFLLAGATTVLAVIVARPGPARPETPVALPERNPEHAPPMVEPAPTAIEDSSLADGTAIKTENDRLAKVVRDLQSEISILNARRTPAPRLSAPAAGLPQVQQRLLSELLGNPETVGLAMDWIKADQAQRFASLIALAGLDGDREAALRGLLAERYATRLDVTAMGLESVSPEQRQQLDADFHHRLEQLVGGDVAALFEKAEGKPVSFARMQRLEDRLRYEARPLDRDQYLPLWELMSSQVFYATPPRTVEDYQGLLQRRTEGAATIAQTATTLLAPDQLTVLRAMLDDDLALARIQTHTAIQALRARRSPDASSATTLPAPP